MGTVKSSVVTTIEISPPPRWSATTEPTPPPRCFTVFSAVFLGTVYCASVFRSAACSDSHLMPRHLIPCETWTHAELVTPPVLPPRVRFPTHAIRSARRSSYAARTSLVAPAAVRASSITCVQVLSPTVLAAATSIDRCYGRLCHLSLAVRWLTSLKWSFCRFAKNFGLNTMIRLGPFTLRTSTDVDVR